ncbi:hypothetical protein IMZ29_10050 [Achromobacter sp. GG226]|uniref:hypothetical protein n=1 Tax=Verticiella alkaliphila TaxID=2779529 RepID=UPI001C0BB96B|nr:hypothetical protein [Verticiella sp. GG226]MBU4610859.1 hypothetical protein [Verticiella sp. GG226]
MLWTRRRLSLSALFLFLVLLVVWLAWTPLRDALDPRVLTLPEPGGERTYFLQTSGSIAAQGSRRAAQIQSELVVRQSLRAEGDTRIMRAEPLYLHVSTDRSSADTINSLSDTQAQQRLRELLAPGVDVELDEAGHPVAARLVAEDAWKALLDKGDLPASAANHEEVMRSLVREDWGPAAFASVDLPAKVGATQTLPARAPLPALRLEVVDVSDDVVTLNLAQAEGDIRVDGRLRIERETGWVQSLALTMAGELPASGGDETSHQTMRLLMRPLDDPGYGALEFLGEYPPMMAQPGDFTLFTLKPASLDQSVAGDVHEFVANDRGLDVFLDSASLDHDVDPGRLWLSDVVAYGARGEPLDLAFLTTGQVRAGTERDGTRYRLVPLTWDHALMARIDRIEARVNHLDEGDPARILLPLQDEPTVLREGASTVTAQPADALGEWDVTIKNAEGDFIFMDITSAPPAGQWHDLESVPGTERPLADTTLLRMTRGGDLFSTSTYAFRYRVDDPSRGLPLAYWAKPERAERMVTLVTGEARYAMLDRPLPPRRIPADAVAEASSDWTWDTLVPTGIERNEIRFALPPAVAQACRLGSEAPDEAGVALTWQQSDPAPAPRQLNLFSKEQTGDALAHYQIKTQDGVRSVFYGIEAKVTLACNGEPGWQSLELPQQDPGWMVPLEAVQGQTPIKDREALWTMVRVRDQGGAVMLPLPNALDKLEANQDELTLEDYLHDGRLRFARPVASVERLALDGEPVAREWTVQLEALP